jgi:hypothetical protein
MTQQGLKQQWFRDQATSTETYNGDIIAAAIALTGVTPNDCNHAHILIVNNLLGTSFTNIQEAKQAMAADLGTTSWDSTGALT